MSRHLKPETLAQIENAVPTSEPATCLDIWRDAGPISHQSVKQALIALVDRGRVLRTQEVIKSRKTFQYRRVR